MTAKTTPNYNNFFFQQQPPPSGSTKNQARLNENESDVNDLHLKMSKKIAQLTKVNLHIFFYLLMTHMSKRIC